MATSRQEGVLTVVGFTLFLLQAVSVAKAPVADPQRTVQAFVTAYNQRDFTSFEQLLDADAVWYNVEGERIVPEVRGRPTLLAWVRNYLTRSCTSCRSELVSSSRSGPYVSTVERATWSRRDGSAASQTSVAVYRVAEGRISEVWYFPATSDNVRR